MFEVVDATLFILHSDSYADGDGYHNEKVPLLGTNIVWF